MGAELRRVLRDRGGNTFIIVTAALMPLLAMVGGAVDIGRSYVTETRLQQACDAGVLAARKQLGSKVATTIQTIKQDPVDPAIFEVPKGYREVALPVTGAGQPEK